MKQELKIRKQGRKKKKENKRKFIRKKNDKTAKEDSEK